MFIVRKRALEADLLFDTAAASRRITSVPVVINNPLSSFVLITYGIEETRILDWDLDV